MKDGGAAFPILEQVSGNLDCTSAGMSLRDYFAGQALAGLVSHSSFGAGADFDVTAARCYAIADAMLTERETSK